MLLHKGVGLGQRLEAVFHVAQMASRLAERSLVCWPARCQ
jgi:hypothetical protein